MKDRNPDRTVTFVVRTNAHGSRALFRHLSIWMNGRWGFRYVTDFTERLIVQEKDNDD